MVTQEQFAERLREHFPDADFQARDLTGGGDHWQLEIRAKAFQGLSMVQQHQLVYKALGEWMKSDIHALALTTKASDES